MALNAAKSGAGRDEGKRETVYQVSYLKSFKRINRMEHCIESR